MLQYTKTITLENESLQKVNAHRIEQLQADLQAVHDETVKEIHTKIDLNFASCLEYNAITNRCQTSVNTLTAQV